MVACIDYQCPTCHGQDPDCPDCKGSGVVRLPAGTILKPKREDDEQQPSDLSS